MFFGCQACWGIVSHIVVKVFGGARVKAGSILIRQLGTRIHPGLNVGVGRDYTLFTKIDGLVKYERLGKDRKRVSVYA